MERYIFGLTRHTPRDVIQLLTHIQNTSKRETLSYNDIREGERAYSSRYFLPEIKDELMGYIPNDQIEAGLDLIGSLHTRTFYLKDLCELAAKMTEYQKVELDKFVTVLFECSALGNIHTISDREHKGRERAYYTFKFRNRHSKLNLQEKFILHRGMWKALNIFSD